MTVVDEHDDYIRACGVTGSAQIIPRRIGALNRSLKRRQHIASVCVREHSPVDTDQPEVELPAKAAVGQHLIGLNYLTFRKILELKIGIAHPSRRRCIISYKDVDMRERLA